MKFNQETRLLICNAIDNVYDQVVNGVNACVASAEEQSVKSSQEHLILNVQDTRHDVWYMNEESTYSFKAELFDNRLPEESRKPFCTVLVGSPNALYPWKTLQGDKKKIKSIDDKRGKVREAYYVARQLDRKDPGMSLITSIPFTLLTSYLDFDIHAVDLTKNKNDEKLNISLVKSLGDESSLEIQIVYDSSGLIKAIKNVN